ncbi:hypothetical protein [Asticcacaulis sp. AC402]|uniref:hypothetical protein n=1 Tax=Asticcacaulis sp. AC402 TaxID=1282361 RepID=UPI0003C3C94C|nr:hypothetical protein [Asticcacaulis sp. AC402]ESQ75310.1 hypothetical protein ABAC402_09400 [Asticcacaulis sp. AC402]
MTEGSRPSLESIVGGPRPRWQHRTARSIFEYVVGLPVCIGLGLAFNIWRPEAELNAIAVAVAGFLLTVGGLFLSRWWYARECAWQHSELLSRAGRHGYSEADVVDFEERLESEQYAREDELCR